MEDAAVDHGAAGEGKEGGTVQLVPAEELWRAESGLDKLGV